MKSMGRVFCSNPRPANPLSLLLKPTLQRLWNLLNLPQGSQVTTGRTGHWSQQFLLPRLSAIFSMTYVSYVFITFKFHFCLSSELSCFWSAPEPSQLSAVHPTDKNPLDVTRTQQKKIPKCSPLKNISCTCTEKHQDSDKNVWRLKSDITLTCTFY